MPKPELLSAVFCREAKIGANITLEGVLPAVPCSWVADSTDHLLHLQLAFAVRNLAAGNHKLSMVGVTTEGEVVEPVITRDFPAPSAAGIQVGSINLQPFIDKPGDFTLRWLIDGEPIGVSVLPVVEADGSKP